ncbi:MAG: hypothetical protein PHE17_18210 [Thiothrix sp.]|uniref:hypothetical protein n=1 Tax=Thiothrix sp. TaxID=1032 RepID=UPI00261E2283|nr:hypothetical protein [Thiothrix sp.]MDD5394956.1 hypothetical protein [Thiothrix sp.]
MPYKSDAQRRFFHSAGAAKAGISKKTVKEWDKVSKGKALSPIRPKKAPERKEKKC